MTEPSAALNPGDALIIVHVQNDFCPGGALPIAGGDEVVPVLNKWIAAAADHAVPVYASRDWHPAGHISFQESGGPWPPHCLQDSEGAAFHPDLKLPTTVTKVTSGVRFDKDQYSAFDQTGLAAKLKGAGIKRLWIGGLAQDVCVLATVLDACREGFETHVILDATRPISPEGGEDAVKQMREAGAILE